MITSPFPKGRILDDTRRCCAAGIDVLEDPESSRKLILPTQRDACAWCWSAPAMFPYVQQGGADIGISGKGRADGAGHGGPLRAASTSTSPKMCRLMVAVRDETDYDALVQRGRRLRVATKYIHTARAHFAKKGVRRSDQALRLNGAGPLVGMADAIVDVVSSGATLKTKQPQTVEKIADISARLIVNQAALKTKRDALMPIVEPCARNRWKHA